MDKVKFLLTAFSDYTGGNHLWIFCVAALIYVLIRGGKEARDIFGWPLLIQFLTIFNPLIAKKAAEILGLESRYLRFIWMIPYLEFTAFAIVMLMRKAKTRYTKTAAAAAAAVVIVLLGRPVFFGEDVPGYELPENQYYTNDEYIELSEIFHSEGKERMVVLYDGLLLLRFRTYDPAVVSTFNRNEFQMLNQLSEEEFNEQRVNISKKIIADAYWYHDFDNITTGDFRKALGANRVRYVVTNSGSESNQYMEQAGLVLIGETENYKVWRIKYMQQDLEDYESLPEDLAEFLSAEASSEESDEEASAEDASSAE